MIVVGHRGCALLEPENTLRGFRRALALGCDYVETDVRLTQDGQMILMHDARVDRTTNGTGAVAELLFAEIRTLDAGVGEQVPTLAELLPVLRGRAQLLCELKGEGTADEAVRTVREAGMEREVVFTCFELERLRRVKEIDSGLRCGALFSEPPPDFARQAREVGAESASVNYRYQSAEVIAAARAEGLTVRAWNPDTEEEIQRMLVLQPDGIGSNRPDLVLRLLGRLR
jgi:glycerophosphoryl diester phosphodiesterase